jgi:hypothetical protein
VTDNPLRRLPRPWASVEKHRTQPTTLKTTRTASQNGRRAQTTSATTATIEIADGTTVARDETMVMQRVSTWLREEYLQRILMHRQKDARPALADGDPPRRSATGHRDEPRSRRDEPRRDRRRERDSYDSYDEHYPPRRPREDKYKDTKDKPRDRGGYVSDDRHNRPRYDDRDRRDRPRDDRDRRDRPRDDRYDDMFNSPGRSSRRDPRDRRDRYDDDRHRDSRSGGRAVGKPGQPEWQRQAMTMFKEYAMPIIKKEGQKYIAKQMGGMGSKR